jgi:regulator of sigma E protease
MNWLEIWRYAQVALGIGLVIFVHESGHFVAARLCRVRVDVFSLGFGPRIFGWRRRGTQYQLALVPLGGYVKMAGEEPSESGRAPAPDELPSKSVAQRFFIYSGGVLANVAFGLVVFPIILALGVPFPEPLLGPSTPGSPAWFARLPEGTRVLSVNGNEVFGFLSIPNEVALGSPEGCTLEILEPGAREPRRVRLKPVYAEDPGVYSIGVNPAVDPSGEIVVDDSSKAADAGLRSGDHLVRVEGGIEGLTHEEQLAMAMQHGDPVRARFEHEGRELDVELTSEPSKSVALVILGVAPLVNQVVGVRDSDLTRPLGLEKDDRIIAIDAYPILREFDILRALLRGDGVRKMTIDRAGRRLELATPRIAGSQVAAFASDIGVVPDMQGTRIAVNADSAAADAGLRDGDRVVKIDDKPIASYKPDIKNAAEAARGGRGLEITAERVDASGAVAELKCTVAPRAWKPPIYGLGLQAAQYIYKAHGPSQALRVGIASSWKFLEESWRTLEHIVKGQVSGTNIGGIITIGVVSHSWASVGLTKLFFFLCMLSMNLAFLNVLPIPVLDGGHLFFLLIEKVKGSPVSERVLGYSQMVGIVLIVSLMVYVTFNDIKRWIWP